MSRLLSHRTGLKLSQSQARWTRRRSSPTLHLLKQSLLIPLILLLSSTTLSLANHPPATQPETTPQPSCSEPSRTTLPLLPPNTARMPGPYDNLTLPVPPPAGLRATISVPQDRLLMGPGPSNCPPRVQASGSLPVIGHMHPETFKVMDDIKAGLKYLFQTENDWTLVVSGPGHLAMEAIFVNLLEQGETIAIGCNGLWGDRATDLAIRLGLNPVRIEVPVGQSVPLSKIEACLVEHKPKVLFLVHSESSTGVMQPLEGVGEICRKHSVLLAVDTVASLGGVPFFADKWGVDAMYTGSQKVIGAPPGIAPISFGPRAVEKIKSRKTPIKSYLLDMTQLSVYWACSPGDVRFYHHTPPVSLFYGMREGLALLVEEGLPAVWNRHAKAAARLHAGLARMGLELFVEKESDRLPTVTTIKVPAGVDWKGVIKTAMEKYNVEISGGLGKTAGLVFRIGVMGYNAGEETVDRALKAFEEALRSSKY